jgi:uncharacterized membrane protein YcaP (DUF421 family)
MTNPVVRGIIIYLFLLLIFRISGKRTLSQTTTFEFVLLLVIGEATQQALLGDDFSITNALLLITTLMGINQLLSWLKERSPLFEDVVESVPLILVDNGTLFKDRMKKVRIDEKDILEAARTNHGLARMEQIRYAVLERNGIISIIPREEQ